MDTFWLAITTLGRDEVFIVVLALYTWLVNPYAGRTLGVVFATSYLLNSALKYGLDLPRPFTGNPTAATEAARATAGGPGLPSGHTQMAATLWGGLAFQVNRGWMWGVALTLTLLISVSRLALNVHYPADVIVGLLLGAIFAAAATRVSAPEWGVARWLPPLAVLLIAALLPASAPRELAAGLGLFAGFWWVRPTFTPPTTLAGRVIVSLVGLLLVFVVYFGLSALPADIRNLGLIRALRYALLVVVAAEGVPALLRRWMPRGGGATPLQTSGRVQV